MTQEAKQNPNQTNNKKQAPNPGEKTQKGGTISGLSQHSFVYQAETEHPQADICILQCAFLSSKAQLRQGAVILE